MSKILGSDGRQQGLNVDPSSMKDIKCENCGCKMTEISAFKRIFSTNRSN